MIQEFSLVKSSGIWPIKNGLKAGFPLAIIFARNNFFADAHVHLAITSFEQLQLHKGQWACMCN
jgi:hypothetical protein